MEERKKYKQEKKDEFASAFLEKNEIPKYLSYNIVSRFRSIKRAIRRGKIDLYTGLPLPRRPFSNRKATLGRKFNELRKRIYEEYTKRRVQ